MGKKDRREERQHAEWRAFKKVWNQCQSIHEVSDKVGMSTNGCASRASAMRKRGYFLKDFGKAGEQKAVREEAYVPTEKQYAEAIKEVQEKWTPHEWNSKLRVDWRPLPVQATEERGFIF